MDSWKDSDPQNELSRLRREVDKLRAEKLLQGDEIRALKTETRSYQDELQSLNSKSKENEAQALQETLAGDIGRQVRLRYLEQHRKRMGKGIGKVGHERIKCGDRAAHRGRPAVDAMLCLTGVMTDPEVYKDLYGVDPEIMRQCKDVPEVVEITSFRASLQSEGKLTKEFQVLFERLIQKAMTYRFPSQLTAAFKEDKAVQQLHVALQGCYDKIVAANPRGRQNSTARNNR